MEFVLFVFAFVILLFLGAIYYMLQKGFNEIIKGLMSLDTRLAQIENAIRTQNETPD